jgi:SAM-dependent methyltransferase
MNQDTSTQPQTVTCKICHSTTGGKFHRVTDMMYGREQFSYLECPECQSLQLVDQIDDMSRYYPADYYSFNHQSPLKSYLKSVRCAQYLGKKSLLGHILAKRFGAPPVVSWVQNARIKKDANILDIGCGQGIALRDLSKSGFRKLKGLDPYLEKSMRFGPVELMKGEIDDLHESFDFIMLNHSLEHVIDPEHVMTQLHRILDKDGEVLIRVPILGYSWEHYGTDWIALDAPRHLYIFSPESIKILAERTGFKVRDVIHDSDAFSFWGSEQLKQGIYFLDANSYAVNPQKSIFSDADIQRFERKAQELNAAKRADQACFYLTKQ